MRMLEIIVLMAALAPVFGLLTPERTPGAWMHVLPLLAAVLALAQLLVEGYRWQMLPAYSLIGFLVLYEAGLWAHSEQTSFYTGVGAVFVWLAAVVLSAALPVFEFPRPTGPFQVGTEVRHLTDLHRRETLSSNPSDPRELMVQIWYPVDPSFRGELAPYRSKEVTNWRTAQLVLVKTNAYLSAPLASAQRSYPVLVFSPSWSGQRVQNTFQIQELASHGYIVVAMDHPYGTDITVFPDGRIARTKLGVGEDYSSQEAFEHFVREAEQQVKVRAEDARFVIDKLEEFNRQDPEGLLTGKLDLNQIGIFGHSLGGSVAAQACWLDARFKAALDMDGMVAGESAHEGSNCPIFFMMEDDVLPAKTALPSLSSRDRRVAEFGYEQAALMEVSLNKSGGYRMVIQGTTHRNFSDSPFFSPLKSLTGAGPIPTKRCAQIVNQYSLAFFDKTLGGKAEPLLESLSHEFPEARLEVWNARTQVGSNGSQVDLAPVGMEPNTNLNSAALLTATEGRR
jgi:dienelactone hydrolase